MKNHRVYYFSQDISETLYVYVDTLDGANRLLRALRHKNARSDVTPSGIEVFLKDVWSEVGENK